eukprot:scaffold103644_cov16-Tisochrysis_lutea.AAC.1
MKGTHQSTKPSDAHPALGSLQRHTCKADHQGQGAISHKSDKHAHPYDHQGEERDNVKTILHVKEGTPQLTNLVPFKIRKHIWLLATPSHRQKYCKGMCQSTASDKASRSESKGRKEHHLPSLAVITWPQ